MLPYFISKTITKMTMEEVNEPDQMVYDIRTEKEKYIEAHNIRSNTLSESMNLFSDKPEIIKHGKSKDLYWFPSVCQLRG